MSERTVASPYEIFLPAVIDGTLVPDTSAFVDDDRRRPRSIFFGRLPEMAACFDEVSSIEVPTDGEVA